MTLQRRQKIELTIDRMAHGGAGVGQVNGVAVLVPGTAPGDRVRARVTRRRQRHAEAHVEEILDPSPLRQSPPCPLFAECGGCRWQHLPYSEQTEAKRRIVAEALAHLRRIDEVPLEAITPSPDEFRYRNKMELTFGTDVEGRPTLGLHRAERFDEIIDVPVCLIQPETFDAMAGVFRDHARREGLVPYDPRTHQGFLRSVTLREGRRTGETLAMLLTAEGELPGRERLVEALRHVCPGLRGFVWGINTAKADAAMIERTAWLWGETTIHDRLGDQTFAVSPTSFFQTNTPAAEILLRLVDEALGLSAEDILLDVFCGTGVIGIHCAPFCRHVFGVELQLPAVHLARRNAAANGLSNCTFIAGDARQTLALAREVAGQRISRVVVDPPRGGMHRKALARIIEFQAPLFVYVSCNPTTLARDLQELQGAGYTVERLWLLDMFPQTYHVETVVRLTR
jgi:23S rRNA (uracil1939-C5)-methyltransferase